MYGSLYLHMIQWSFSSYSDCMIKWTSLIISLIMTLHNWTRTFSWFTNYRWLVLTSCWFCNVLKKYQCMFITYIIPNLMSIVQICLQGTQQYAYPTQHIHITADDGLATAGARPSSAVIWTNCVSNELWGMIVSPLDVVNSTCTVAEEGLPRKQQLYINSCHNECSPLPTHH